MLKDGIIKVPSKSYRFSNAEKFDNAIYSQIDINYLYEIVERFDSDNQFNQIKKRSLISPSFLQFYKNGKVRNFNYLNPDPNVTGYRGIVYKKNNIFFIDEASFSSDRSLKIYTYKLKIEGDKIYLLEMPKTLFKPSEYTCLVYQKSQKIPEEWKKYKADW